jgi:Fe2+ or Zn2+ uptake regulation protein
LDVRQPKRTPRTLAGSYHISSPATSLQEALAGEKRARGQEALVLALFQALDGEHLTPSEVCNKINQGRIKPILLWSVRRAITNLTTRGLLVHHKHDRRPGPYTSLQSTWGLA